jgi:6-pyruvoyltetrahydropterin/6-carboxytetrahydropterin synthase
MKTQAVRKIQFCAGHRIYGHESKCKNMHGHNFIAFFHAEAVDGLDEIGRVIDFNVLKTKIGGWIEDNWDHSFIFWVNDEIVKSALAQIGEAKMYPLPANPTVENMAAYLLTKICPAVLKDINVKVTKIVLWETENCYAEVSLD